MLLFIELLLPSRHLFYVSLWDAIASSDCQYKQLSCVGALCILSGTPPQLRQAYDEMRSSCEFSPMAFIVCLPGKVPCFFVPCLHLWPRVVALIARSVLGVSLRNLPSLSIEDRNHFVTLGTLSRGHGKILLVYPSPLHTPQVGVYNWKVIDVFLISKRKVPFLVCTQSLPSSSSWSHTAS